MFYLLSYGQRGNASRRKSFGLVKEQNPRFVGKTTVCSLSGEGGRPEETYTIGGNNQPTNLEILRLICTILDERFPESEPFPHEKLIQFVADCPGHDRRYAMDISKISRELGWAPRESLESGMRKTVDWYLGHPEWVSAILNRPDYQEWMARNYHGREAPA